MHLESDLAGGEDAEPYTLGTSYGRIWSVILEKASTLKPEAKSTVYSVILRTSLQRFDSKRELCHAVMSPGFVN